MKYKEITEYQMVPTQPFKMPDFSSGQYLSKIKSRKGDIFEIWKMVDEEHLGYAAIDPKIGPKKPIAYLGFQMISVVMMAKNAYTLKKYQKQGILSELFLFVNRIEKYKIISDIELSPSGEALWISLIKSGKFKAKILYVPTAEIFNLSDIGTGQTSDGETVISPKNDDKINYIYNQTTNDGQKFFYLLENKSKEHLLVLENKQNNVFYRKTGILQPNSYFEDDSP